MNLQSLAQWCTCFLRMCNHTDFNPTKKLYEHELPSSSCVAHKDYSKCRYNHPKKKYPVSYTTIWLKRFKNVKFVVVKLLLFLFGYARIQAWNKERWQDEDEWVSHFCFRITGQQDLFQRILALLDVAILLLWLADEIMYC